MRKTLSDEQRHSIVIYRLENAAKTLEEVESHRRNGFYNTAVNRMYYACYYAASAMLISIGVEAKSHDGVRHGLGRHVVLPGLLSADLGRFYSRLFSKRSTGDYDDFVNHTLETVDELLPNARLFVSTITDILQKSFLNKSDSYASRS